MKAPKPQPARQPIGLWLPDGPYSRAIPVYASRAMPMEVITFCKDNGLPCRGLVQVQDGAGTWHNAPKGQVRLAAGPGCAGALVLLGLAVGPAGITATPCQAYGLVAVAAVAVALVMLCGWGLACWCRRRSGRIAP